MYHANIFRTHFASPSWMWIFFTYANIPKAVLSGICFSRFQPRLDAHLHPFFHPIQFHLGYPGTDRSDLGIEIFFCQQDFDLSWPNRIIFDLV